MTQYAYTQLTVQSQANVQGAQPCFIEGSAVLVTASFFDTTGAPWVPNNAYWQLTDVNSGDLLQNWTGIPSDTAVVVQISSMSNSMVSLTRSSETHQVLFRIIDQQGQTYYARALFDIIAVSGL